MGRPEEEASDRTGVWRACDGREAAA